MNHLINIYYFIKDFNSNELLSLDKNINIIFRNYELKDKKPIVTKLNIFCKKIGRKLFISNDYKLALNLDLDCLYIPSFNKNLNFKNLNKKKNFSLIGSAHNISELRIKKLQGCKQVFISPIFKTKKNSFFLDVNRFNLINLKNDVNAIALGGIDSSNIKKLRLTESFGFASISWIKKNQPKKIRLVL